MKMSGFEPGRAVAPIRALHFKLSLEKMAERTICQMLSVYIHNKLDLLTYLLTCPLQKFWENSEGSTQEEI